MAQDRDCSLNAGIVSVKACLTICASLIVALFAISSVNCGHPQGPSESEFQVTSTDRFAQYVSHIATDPHDNFVVVWQSLPQDGDEWGIYARRYDSAANPLGPEFQVNTYVENNQFVPRVATDREGNFAIVWESLGQDGDSYGIYCRRYDRSGDALGEEFQVNTSVANSQHDPFIAMSPSGDFAIVWISDFQDGSLMGVYGQRFDSDGAPIGGEFQLNTYISDDQRQPAVAMDENGNFTAVWESMGQDGSGKGVYARRYDPEGTPKGPEFRVNSTTAGDQADSWIDMNPSGDFVVVWCSTDQDGSGTGIYGQRYNAAGVAQSQEFQVNTHTALDQIYPSVALHSKGDFVVAWQSQGQDGSGFGVFGRRYSSNGTPQGGEFQINGYTSRDQFNPFVALFSTGELVVTWISFGQDGSAEGVFGRRFY